MAVKADSERVLRLERSAERAKAAEARGDNVAASAAWRQYTLIADGGRPAEDLVAQALELMRVTDRVQRIPRAAR